MKRRDLLKSTLLAPFAAILARPAPKVEIAETDDDVRMMAWRDHCRLRDSQARRTRSRHVMYNTDLLETERAHVWKGG